VQGIAKKTCDVLLMLTGFHSVVVDVGDFDSAVGDYGRMLGQAPRWIEANAERRTRSALFPLANMILEIRAEAVAVGAGVEAETPETKGLSGLRLVCDDVERFVGQLESDGIEVGPRVPQKAERSDGETDRTWLSATVDLSASRSIQVELISDETGPQPVTAEPGLDRARSSEIDPQSAIRALDHIVVFSADIEATRDFYADGLGIRLALDRSFEKRGVRLLFFRIGGVTVEIGGRLGVEPQPDSTDRFGGLAWQVPDIDAIQSRLLADRFDVSEICDGNKPGTRVCTVRDPVHNVPTLLIQPVS
jgi:catechol 2,3-dioxygenase-like lactoylglutathione lyase family enzyme